MLFKNEWVFWFGMAGAAIFALIGNLMGYAALAPGMWRVLAFVGVLLLIGTGLLLIVARWSNPKGTVKDYVWAPIVIGGIGSVLFLLVMLGGL